jgi:hypothetical protein
VKARIDAMEISLAEQNCFGKSSAAFWRAIFA